MYKTSANDLESGFCSIKVRNNADISITWSNATRASPYKGTLSRCNLCVREILGILHTDKSTLLNKRSEHVTKCKQKNKLYAANQKQDNSNPLHESVSILFQPRLTIALSVKLEQLWFLSKLFIIFLSISCVSDQRENLITILVTEHILNLAFYVCIYNFFNSSHFCMFVVLYCTFDIVKHLIET